MTLLPCSECNFRTASAEELESHLWTTHRPIREGEFACPSCNIPVTEETFALHYPCLFDDPSPSRLIPSATVPCPLCNRQFESFGALEAHLDSHPEFEQLTMLGEPGACRACDESLSIDNLEAHFECFATVPVQPATDDSHARIACPSSACDGTFDTSGRALYHVWTEHLENSGLDGDCPHCNTQLSFGNVWSHLACLPGLMPAAASALFPQEKTCVLCGMSVYDHSVLHRHYHQQHVSDDYCPECGETFTADEGKDVLDHIGCLVAGDEHATMDDIGAHWRCPVCPGSFSSSSALADHLADTHVGRLRSVTACEVCSKPLDSAETHRSCLIEIARSSPACTFSEDRIREFASVESHTKSSYFGELEEFVQREKTAARDEAWEQYREHSLNTLSHQRGVIQKLVHVRNQPHPRFDHQIVYQIPEEADRKNPQNIPKEYEIYPSSEVILGGGAGGNLARIAVVTFVDSPSIGFALRPSDEAVSKNLLRQLKDDESIYHCAELINPFPFDRRQTAIQQVSSRERLRNLVLGKAPIREESLSLSDAAVGNLNQYQKRAVERALGAQNCLCIHGPPGTGKTRMLVRLIRLAIARGDRVLATAHSNQAIDNLIAGASTPTDPDPDSPHYVASPAGWDRTLPHSLAEGLKQNPDDEELEETAESLLNRPDELTIARVGGNSSSKVVQQEYVGGDVQNADLVAGTMSALAELDAYENFDMVVIDEAAQASQPASFIPLLRGSTVILAGDHHQLPPYAADEKAKEAEMHISLFEHLFDTYGSDISVMLQRQYRMNEQIAAFSNDHVYGGRLKTGEQNREWQIDDLEPIMAVDVAGGEEAGASHSKSNPTEADIVADHVKLLQQSGVTLSEIGVITPYTAQISLIKNALGNKLSHQQGLKVDTIDSFQGSEREAIIVSFVRSNSGHHSGFLAFPEDGKRRLNVAMTRAKKRLVLIGDWDTLGTPASYEPDDSCSTLYSSLYQGLNDRELVKEMKTANIDSQ